MTLIQAACGGSNDIMKAPERWQSGRSHPPRKRAYLDGYREFESPPLRQPNSHPPPETRGGAGVLQYQTPHGGWLRSARPKAPLLGQTVTAATLAQAQAVFPNIAIPFPHFTGTIA